MNINKIYNLIGRKFRKKRMALFSKLFSLNSNTKILDVGGRPFNWQFVKSAPKIDLLNLEPYGYDDLPKNMSFIVGNGLDLKFANHSYDIAYSNSVIEHVGTYENQWIFAKEIKRVGKGLFVQTPAKEFFFDPHNLTPFIHWFLPSLSVSSQKFVLKNFTVWGLLDRPSDDYLEHVVSEIRFLNEREFRDLFSDCAIIIEKFLFFNKSYIAYRLNDF